MIKKILSIACVCATFIAQSQSFTLAYPFASVTPSSGVIDPTPTATVVGVTSGSFTAVGTPSLNANASGRFSFVGWPTGATPSVDTYSAMTGAINTSEYYELILTPVNGYTIAVNTMSFTVQRSGTGIRSYAVRASVDGFASNLPASVTTNTNLSVVGTNEFFWNLDALSNAQNGSTINFFGATVTSSVALRFYAWNSESAGGTFSIDNVSIDAVASGSATPCTSPTISAVNGNAPICMNQTLNLSSSVTGDAPFTYTWTGAGTLATPNASATAITGVTSSDYTLTVENACGTATSVISATVNALPTVSVTSATVCAGNSATLVATGTTTNYAWSTSENTSSVVVTPMGTLVNYTVTGTDANGCSADAISTVTVLALPSVTLDLSTIDLQCVTINAVALVGGMPAGGTYSGTGVTTGNFSPSAAGVGTYTLMYSYSDANCSNMASDVITVDACTGIKTLSSDLFAIYPNPSNGIVIVKSPALNAQVIVFDVNGKKVYTQTTSSFETQLDLSNLSNGVYHLNIISDNQSFNHKIMINK